tara:strand:+ start:735 stop:1088 length:354 start_codon:yes stop_codon:yes gene_type:complete
VSAVAQQIRDSRAVAAADNARRFDVPRSDEAFDAQIEVDADELLDAEHEVMGLIQTAAERQAVAETIVSIFRSVVAHRDGTITNSDARRRVLRDVGRLYDETRELAVADAAERRRHG